MKVAIHQPQFLPWLGHFQKIRLADVFVFLDTVQFQKNEFQNRNRVPGPNGPLWLTVPVSYDFGDPIRAVRVAEGTPWRRKVWGTVEQFYGKSPHFARYAPSLRELLEREWTHLAAINIASVTWLMDCFGITTRTVLASADLGECRDDRTGRLVDVCRHLGATVYLSGSTARRYLELEQFARAGIAVEFQDYHHPVYVQAPFVKKFTPFMSAVDGLLACGGGDEGRRALDL